MNESLNLIVNNISPMDYWNSQDPISVKTQDLIRICGEFSGQAKVAAIVGLILSIIAIFYFGKYRQNITEGLGEVGTIWFDKILLISIAICFAVIITRLFYGG